MLPLSPGTGRDWLGDAGTGCPLGAVRFVVVIGLATAFRRLLALVAAGAILASVSLLIAFVALPREAERLTAGKRPALFPGQVDDDLLDDYGAVLGVAHNSGDSIRATKQALEHGADVVEIDVISVRGRLHAGHDRPLPGIGGRLFRGPPLEQSWKAAAAAHAIKLDLKQSSAGYLTKLIDFLHAHREPLAMVATGHVGALQTLHRQAPWVIRLLSVGSEASFQRLRGDQNLLDLIDGVTVRHALVTPSASEWLEERGLIVLAWTVNSVRRLNELVRLGVDGVITDNLTILELLGGDGRGEIVGSELARSRRG